MRAVLAIFLRELRAYFYSPLAYVVLFFFLGLNGYLFSLIVSALNDPRSGGGPPFGPFFGISWVFLLFLGPILTMRLIAEELKTGSIEVLMTAPVTEGQVVAGKYLAALAFYVALWLPTVTYGAIVSYWNKVDWGPVAAGYLGIFAVGALFLAVGIFASALSKNQLVAAIITFAVVMFVFLLGPLESLITSETGKKVLSYANVLDHMDELAKGIVDTRRLVYYVSATLFFLFLTSRTLAERKWR